MIKSSTHNPAGPTTRAATPFVRRDMEIVFRKLREAMADAIELWMKECTWVTPGGAAARDRAWECFRDWVIDRRADETAKLPLNDDLFHQVMTTRFPVLTRGDSYPLTVGGGFEARKPKPARPALKSKTPLPRKR